jgi:hypothetical protein
MDEGAFMATPKERAGALVSLSRQDAVDDRRYLINAYDNVLIHCQRRRPHEVANARPFSFSTLDLGREMRHFGCTEAYLWNANRQRDTPQSQTATKERAGKAFSDGLRPSFSGAKPK